MIQIASRNYPSKHAILIVFFCLINTLLVAETPKITFVPSVLDFGSFNANKNNEKKFKITNTSDVPIKIIKIRSSCGCTTGSMETNVIRPQKTAELTVTIPAESVTGNFRKNIFLHTDIPGKAILTLPVCGEAKPLAEVFPQKNIYCGEIPSATQVSRQFRIVSKEKIEWGSVTCSTMPNFVPEISIDQSYNDEKQYISLVTVSFTPPADATKNLRLTVSLPIQAPANWKPIELTLSGLITQQ